VATTTLTTLLYAVGSGPSRHSLESRAGGMHLRVIGGIGGGESRWVGKIVRNQGDIQTDLGESANVVGFNVAHELVVDVRHVLAREVEGIGRRQQRQKAILLHTIVEHLLFRFICEW